MKPTDFEHELRATLAEAGQQARLVDDLGIKAARPVRRRRTWLASGLAAAAVAVIATVVAVTAPDGGDPGLAASPSSHPSAGRPIAIATSSWKPGDGELQSLSSGVLRATPQGCPYLTSPDPRATHRTALIWPAGYTARYGRDGKVEVVAPNGFVVGREGDELAVGGGVLSDAQSGQRCTLGANTVFTIMEDLTR